MRDSKRKLFILKSAIVSYILRINIYIYLFSSSYTVPKKEATEFTKELVNKVENSTLKVAVEKALLFLEKNELPPHWDKDSLFGNSVSSGNSDYDGELDSDVRSLAFFFFFLLYNYKKIFTFF